MQIDNIDLVTALCAAVVKILHVSCIIKYQVSDATYVAIIKFMLSWNFTIPTLFIWHERGQEELSLLKIGESSAKCLTLSTPLWVEEK